MLPQIWKIFPHYLFLTAISARFYHLASPAAGLVSLKKFIGVSCIFFSYQRCPDVAVACRTYTIVARRPYHLHSLDYALSLLSTCLNTHSCSLHISLGTALALHVEHAQTLLELACLLCFMPGLYVGWLVHRIVHLLHFMTAISSNQIYLIECSNISSNI